MYQADYESPGVASRPLDNESKATLLIRHLPEAIPHDTLSRLLLQYGASSVRPCTSGRLRNCAFVDFNDEALASQAQRQLHGLTFMGKLLSVERAHKPIGGSEMQKSDSETKDIASSTPFIKNPSMVGRLVDGCISGSGPPSEPIALSLGVDYSFPPHIEYAYPPPDGNILTNVVNALIAVPRFYTQVLHLMNKMNIPAPFRMALPTPPLPPSASTPPLPPPPPPPPIPVKPQMGDLSSGESEMESSDEGVEERNLKMGKIPRKRVKRENIVGPAVDKDVGHEAVGLKPATLVPKEIPIIKKKNPVLQIKIASKPVLDELKDDSIRKESEEPEKDDFALKPYATVEEIKSGKVPPEEILSLPMFKNYTAGDPAPVLYIKNLSKEVIADDFYFIFGSIFGSLEASRSTLNVKLMQEGRMRGQAFVTFPTVELAQHALAESGEWICFQREAHDHSVRPESCRNQSKINKPAMADGLPVKVVKNFNAKYSLQAKKLIFICSGSFKNEGLLEKEFRLLYLEERIEWIVRLKPITLFLTNWDPLQLLEKPDPAPLY